VRSKEADYVMESIGSLRQIVPEIWGAVDDQAGLACHGEEGHAVRVGVHHPANVDDPGLIPSAGALIFLHIHLK
jgi:hypothetical protein